MTNSRMKDFFDLWVLLRDQTLQGDEVQLAIEATLTRLGSVEAERFVASISKDRFNYTEWRRTALPETDLVELSRQATAFSKQRQN